MDAMPHELVDRLDDEDDEEYSSDDDDELIPAHPDDIADYLHDLEEKAGRNGQQAKKEASEFFRRALDGGVRLVNQRDGRPGRVNRIDVGTLSGYVNIRIDYDSGETEYDTAGVLAAYHAQLSGAKGKFIFL